MRKRLCLLSFFLIIITMSFTSCNGKKDPERLYLTNKLYYYSADRSTTITSIKMLDRASKVILKKLDPKDFNHLSKFVTENSYLWLKASFIIPPSLKNEDLGLNIPYLRTCSECYLNGNLVGSYGSFPPNEFTPGFVSNYYLLPQSLLNIYGENTIYLKIWVGGWGSISKNLYIHFYCSMQ